MATYYRWNRYNYSYSYNKSKSVSNGTNILSRVYDTYVTIYYSNSLRVNKNNTFDLSASMQLLARDDQTVSVSNLYFSLEDSSPTIAYFCEGSGQLGSKGDSMSGYDIEVQGNNFSVGTGTMSTTSAGQVYSNSSSTYPNGDVSGDYYYDNRITITSPTDPTNISYPSYYLSSTNSITLTWTASVSSVPDYPLSNYEVEYAINNSGTFNSAGTTNTNSYTFNIPSGTTSIRFRVRAKDTNNQYSSYTTGSWSNLWNFTGFSISPEVLVYNSAINISWGLTGPSFILQRKSSSDVDWVQVYSGTNTSFSETVGLWSNVQYRIQAYSSGQSISDWNYSEINIVYYMGRNIQMNYKESNGLYSLLYPNTTPLTTASILLSSNSINQVSSLSSKSTLDDLLQSTTISQVGEYQGTGLSGQENPNILYFNLRPVLLEVESIDTGEKLDESKVVIEYNSNNVTWYANNEVDQMNELGKKYNYRAILINDQAQN